MKLTEAQVIEIAKKPVADYIATCVTEQDAHNVHVRGDNYESLITQLVGYETVEQYKLKKLISRPFTKHIFNELIKSLNRWKTSQGTTKHYKFSSDKSKVFTDDVLDVAFKGMSIDNFVQNFHANAIFEEFNGFYLIEQPRKDEGGYYRDGDLPTASPAPYIVFKSIGEVRSFRTTGNRIEWICLDHGKTDDTQLIRVIDDEKDWIVESKSGTYTVSAANPPLPHNAGKCPAVRVSPLNKTIFNDNVKTSPLHPVIELADYCIHRFAEHVASDILHAHPKYYQIAADCDYHEGGVRCNDGSIAYVNDLHENISKMCPKCKGSGKNLKFDASTVLNLPLTDSNGNQLTPTAPGGYITPPVDILKYQQEAIDWLRAMIFRGVTNVGREDGATQAVTATEVVVNLRPLEDVISSVIDMVETTETQITDLLGTIYAGKSYKGCEIVYGRKLNLRDETTLLNEIESAKASGASTTAIKSLNDEYVYSRFIRSEEDLQRNKLLSDIEPLPGYTWNEVESSKYVSDDTKIVKQNFQDFINRFEEENGDILLFKQENPNKVKLIKEILYKFAEETKKGTIV